MPLDTARTVLVTGAGGFVGRRLLRRLLDRPGLSRTRVVALDLMPPDIDDPRVRPVAGDLAEPRVLDEALRDGAELVFHLAGILGGAAEADYPLSRRINIDGTLDLLDRLRERSEPPRVVFASSIAVFGPPLPAFVDDDTIPLPVMTYGAQKLMIETVVEQFSARGWIDGLALRLPGVVARRDADQRQRAAFLNRVFHAAADREEFEMPVSAAGTTWLLSVPAVIDALVHAAAIPRERLGRRRAFALPAQVVRIGELVEALDLAFPGSQARIRYRPDPELEAQFASQPPLATGIADRLGFRHDGDLGTLIRRALEG